MHIIKAIMEIIETDSYHYTYTGYFLNGIELKQFMKENKKVGSFIVECNIEMINIQDLYKEDIEYSYLIELLARALLPNYNKTLKISQLEIELKKQGFEV